MEKISQFASSADKIRSLTGFTDSSGDLTKDLFTLVGLLELYSSAYLDADCFFARTHSISTVVNPPRDRLLCYLHLISNLKRAATSQVSRKRESSVDISKNGAQSSRTSSTSHSSTVPFDMNELKNVDFTNVDEILKLKGAILDEQLLRLLLQSFTKKQEMLLEQERLKAETALAIKQEAIEQGYSQFQALKEELVNEKCKAIQVKKDL